jgi:uncharacterized protein (DUF1800 family)
MTTQTHTTPGGGNRSGHPPVRSLKSHWFALAAALLVACCGVWSTSADIIGRDYWTNITGGTVSNLTNNANYPNNPSGSDVLFSLEAVGWVGSTNAGGTNRIADNYGQRIRGFILPQSNGTYRFWIRSDRDSELWLSTSSNPATKVRIAYVTNTVAQTTAGWNTQTNQQSAPITLTTGRKYIEIIHKENTGNDHLAVGWLRPWETGTAPSEIIPGSRLLPWGTPTLTEREKAARFLGQATFGPTEALITSLTNSGNDFEAWISNQFNLPVSSHLVPLLPMTNYNSEPGGVINVIERRKMWTAHAMQGADHLRQRVAFALSEIFVISDVSASLRGNPLGMADYYDRLLTNAFGNFTNLLTDVSRHPAMGVYLSHLRNKKENPSAGTFPDENYAREVMQLFSVGLWMLNGNGSEVADTNGLPIPTYGNADITNLAKVFTGYNYPNSTTFSNGGNFNAGFIGPMKMYETFHDTNSKTFLFYNATNPGAKQTIPAGTLGLTDLTNAIKVLVNHPNTPPFIARRLIQRLVTSNPTTDYINRVAAKFRNNGSGIRGDMKAVIRQVLMDAEAREVEFTVDPAHGKLREPFIAALNIARAFNAAPFTSSDYYFFPTYWPYLNHTGTYDLGMTPQASPSVFNFFKPDFQPEGEVRDMDLFAPEFEILSHATAHSVPNYFKRLLDNGNTINFSNRMTLAIEGGRVTNKFTLNYATELSLATNAANLVDRLDELLTYGTLSANTRSQVTNAISGYGTTPTDLTNRVKHAIYLITTSPDFMIQK